MKRTEENTALLHIEKYARAHEMVNSQLQNAIAILIRRELERERNKLGQTGG